MSALIDKMNSLPKASSVILGGDDEIVINDQQEGASEAEPAKEQLKDQQEPAATEKPKEAAQEDKEPPANATKEQREAYKQRKLKAADEAAASSKAEAEKYKKEAEDARKEREEWKKQAQDVARRSAPTPDPAKQTPAKQEIDITKDPVGYLAKGLEDVNKRYEALEIQQTTVAAKAELAELENDFAKSNADYHDLMKHAEDTEVKKAKLFNPNANEAAIRANFQNDKIKAAVTLLANGHDPVKGLYDLTMASYNYQPKAKEPDPKLATDKKKADEKSRFDAVNKNKSKSATGLSAGGSTTETEVRGPSTTKKRTLRDFAKLTKEQKDADYVQEG